MQGAAPDLNLDAFYPSSFKALADSTLQLINMVQDDITVINCRFVYCFLLTAM